MPIKLDEDLKLFVTIGLDVKIRGIGLQFIESCEEIWVLLKDDPNFSADN